MAEDRAGAVLVAGAAGFIGPMVLRVLLRETDRRIIVLDKLTYAGRRDNITRAPERAEDAGRVTFVQGDICDLAVQGLLEACAVTWLVNLAAESHVDRSLGAAPDFLRTEMQGTLNLLEAVRATPAVTKFVAVGTDEVYGSIDRNAGYEGERWYALARKQSELRTVVREHLFREGAPLRPGSPYAATKAGADLLVHAFVNSYRRRDGSPMPCVVTRGTNNYGPFQHPEKLLPLAICTLLRPDVGKAGRRRVPIYDDGLAVREWLHTEDHAYGILRALQSAEAGATVNFGSGVRCLNRDLLQAVFREVSARAGTPFASLAEASFPAARAGHDLCYGADCTAARTELGWEPRHTDLDLEIGGLVQWYIDNQDWWMPVWEGADFDAYWQSKYAARLADAGSAPYRFYDEEAVDRPLAQALV